MGVDSLERQAEAPTWCVAVAEAVPMPAALMSADGRVLYANRCLLHRAYNGPSNLGWPCTAESPVGDLLEGCRGLRPVLDEAIRAGRAVGEVRLGPAGANGSGPAIQVHAGVLPSGSDGHTLILVTFQQPDAAETLRQELETCERKYRELFQASIDLVFVMDLDGTLAFVNKSWQRRVGYDSAEILGTNGLALVFPESYPVCRAALQHAGAGHHVENMEFRARTKDGVRLDVLANLGPVCDAQGRVVQVIGSGRDITELKRTQEQLVSSEERLRILFEYAPHEGIAYLDDVGRVLDVNKKTLEILGQTKEQIVGKHFIELGILDPGDVPRFMDHFRQVLLGTPEPLNLLLTGRQGERRYLECSTSVVRKRTGVRGLVVLLRDVTERKRAEMLLEDLNRDLQGTIRELERSNQELRDFAHVAAHDLKAPLRGIVTLAEWISQDCADKIDDQGRENLHLLRQRVDRMIRLIDGILRYAEIGHGDPLAEDVDTNMVVAEAIEQIAPPEHIEIRVESPLPAVLCERVRLAQVFLNLISNAVKYMDKAKGEIRISAVEEGDFWRFNVADNGTGIESRHFDRLFQMFQTLGSSNHGESTGIGLAVVKKIVQMHGGRVGIESEIGRGSTFFFTLPKQNERMTHEKCQTCVAGRR